MRGIFIARTWLLQSLMSSASAGAHSATVLTSDDVRRAVTRIAHEIVERNNGLSDVVLVGMQRGGVWLSQLISQALARIEPTTSVDCGSIDVSMYRDDLGKRPILPVAATDIPVDVEDRVIVLVDDVLFTGRTVRAALDALIDHGRPRAVQLAVLVDRGHRQLPIRPDYVGKNIPTHITDEVDASVEGVMVRASASSGAVTQ